VVLVAVVDVGVLAANTVVGDAEIVVLDVADVAVVEGVLDVAVVVVAPCATAAGRRDSASALAATRRRRKGECNLMRFCP
jgi:hypothetical protein